MCRVLGKAEGGIVRGGLLVLLVFVAACTAPGDAAQLQGETPPMISGRSLMDPEALGREPAAAAPRESFPVADAAGQTATRSSTRADFPDPDLESEVPAPIEELILIGDSVAGQLAFAAQQRSFDRGGPAVRWVTSPGAGAATEDWADAFERDIPDAASTAIVMLFGVWQGVPPAYVEDQLPGINTPEVLTNEIRRFLEPSVTREYARTSRMMLLHSIDLTDDSRLQVANEMIRGVAEDLGMTIDYTIPATDLAGGSLTVRVGDSEYAVRDLPYDAIHYCAAAALAMADELLDDLGVPRDPLEESDIAVLRFIAPENQFNQPGC